MDSPPDLSAALARVGALHAELDAMRPLEPDAVGRAMQRLRLEWTYHSNALEGNSLTYGETVALLMHGVTAQGKPLKDHLDIRGHRAAIGTLEALVQDDEPLTLATIRELLSASRSSAHSGGVGVRQPFSEAERFRPRRLSGKRHASA